MYRLPYYSSGNSLFYKGRVGISICMISEYCNSTCHSCLLYCVLVHLSIRAAPIQRHRILIQIAEVRAGPLRSSSLGICLAWCVRLIIAITASSHRVLSSIYSSTCLLVCHWDLRSCTSSDHALKGVVVESFSYVFQLVGGAKSITREEMRAFKKVWAEFANPRTGYLEKGQIVPFLGVSNLFYDLCT